MKMEAKMWWTLWLSVEVVDSVVGGEVVVNPELLE